MNINAQCDWRGARYAEKLMGVGEGADWFHDLQETVRHPCINGSPKSAAYSFNQPS